MNIEDLNPCPICGNPPSSITIDVDDLCHRNGERIGIYHGTFECHFCGSTIKLDGNSAKQIYAKWNDLARK